MATAVLYLRFCYQGWDSLTATELSIILYLQRMNLMRGEQHFHPFRVVPSTYVVPLVRFRRATSGA